MDSVGILGFGRFGKVLSNFLQIGFKINEYDLYLFKDFLILNITHQMILWNVYLIKVLMKHTI